MIDLLLKITLTEEGIESFIMHHKKLDRFRTADNMLEYGISLKRFPPSSLQKLIMMDYVSRIEISRAEFLSKRSEIMDLTKLIVYGILYKKFDGFIYQTLVESPLVDKRSSFSSSSHRITSKESEIDEAYLKNILSKDQHRVGKVAEEILAPVIEEIKNDSSLSKEEQEIKVFLSEKYLQNLRRYVWYILLKSEGLQEYYSFLPALRDGLKKYLEIAKISEYLSLMLMELAIYAENTNLQKVAKEMYPNSKNIEDLILNENIRKKILQRVERDIEYLYLIWRIRGKKFSIGTENRLQITLFNREYRHRKLQHEIENKKRLNLKEKTLFDFYKNIPEKKINTELGLYYLSYLNEACEKMNIRFDSIVSQQLQSGLTVITLCLF